MINTVGQNYLTSNIEGGEFSYVKQAGSKEKLTQMLGRTPIHYKLDIRFFDEASNTAVLIETKQHYVDADVNQLRDYVDEEKALFPNNKIIAILANTQDESLRVWKNCVEDESEMPGETAIDSMEYYVSLFETSRQNNREQVLRNTYALNELLHKKDIDEKLRSQFVGTTLLYVKDIVKKLGISKIDDTEIANLRQYWATLDGAQIRTGIETTLNKLLDGSENKEKKILLLRSNVVKDQKVRNLKLEDWLEILIEIVTGIYAYIDEDSSEGQDLLNLFFIAFNKYTGKADKNQAFTPDHITEFACRATGVNRNTRIFDGTCGSGSFLVQGMVKAIADCTNMNGTQQQKENQQAKIRREHIYGIEIEEKAYGLATTNMLIHGDGNSNIKLGNLFESGEFLQEADPDVILMNPPFNAKPITIPQSYKEGWGKAASGKEDPTKGMVFVQFVSDCIIEANEKRQKNNESAKTVRMAVILPVAAAIGANKLLREAKKSLLVNNTLEAVFTLPNEIFYPGASVTACMMIFTLGKPHYESGVPAKKTFFGYFKDDAHKKKKNLGRIEQFDDKNASKWKAIEQEWLSLYRNRTVKAGMSAMQEVTHDDEWLVEAYMKTDYSALTADDFKKTVNHYLAYLVKEGALDLSGETGARDVRAFLTSLLESGEFLQNLNDQIDGSEQFVSLKLPIKLVSAEKTAAVPESLSTPDGYMLDWQFIEDLLQSAGCKPSITSKARSVPKLDQASWGTFKVGDFFEIKPTKTYKGLAADDLDDGGSTPFVVNSSVNNGIGGFSSLPPTEDGGKITFSDTTDGNTFFFQPAPFIGFSHVQGMYENDKHHWTQEELLFLTTILTLDSSGRYNYGRKMTRETIKSREVLLPVTSEGAPDWPFMDEYMRSLPYGDRLPD